MVKPLNQKKFEAVEENGITFLFKYDEDAPDLLHIYARHLTTIDDALNVYFNTKPKWNKKHNRYENYSDTHGIYWFWLNEANKKVIVITCFNL